MEADQLDIPRAEHSGVRQSPREQLLAVWKEVAPQLRQLARACGIKSNQAEDILQDVYLIAWEKGPTEANHGELRSWLFKVTANRCKLEHRRENRWRRVQSSLKQWWRALRETPAATDAVVEAEELELVRRGLERLPDQLRLVLVLRYYSGFDSHEIGKILELPASTVRGHLRTARTKLAGELRRTGYPHD
jgi:RNA polymerase sigma-70 factor, ECF subfamily